MFSSVREFSRPHTSKTAMNSSKDDLLLESARPINFMCGTKVYDMEQNLLGTISQVYCSARTLAVKYLEIAPLDLRVKSRFCHPFDKVTVDSEHKARIDVRASTFFKSEANRCRAVLSSSEDSLVTYDQALDYGFEKILLESSNKLSA